MFAANEFSGRWAGTMCLSEPQAGSSLGDIATRAVPDGADFADDPLGPRYRLKGNKMWISAGEHEITENIVHLVLAKIPDAEGKLPAGVKGISLFIVPKFLPVLPAGDASAAELAERVQLGVHNDVALANKDPIAALRDALQQVQRATRAAWANGKPAEALANAVPYMQAFGHTVLA